jgi:hypothetical protein
MKRAVALVTTTALLAGAVLASCTRDSTAPTVRAVAPTLTVTASDTLGAYAHRDSLHRVAAKRDIDSIAPDPHLSAKSKRAIARMRAREDSLILALAIADTTTVVVQQPPPPQPPPPTTCTLVVDWNTRAQPALAKPAYMASTIDPVFGTTLTRISGDVGATIPTVGGTWPATVKQNYPKDPVWTADGALMVLKYGFTNSAALFLDGSSYAPLFFRGGPSGGGEWRLHPTLADIAVVVRADGTVSHWNVRTNVTTTKVAAVSGYTSNTFGPYEGNMSRDGRYIVAQATRSSDGHLVARVIDITAGAALNIIDLTAAGITGLDWVTISASGNYVVAFDNSQYTRVWSRAGALLWYWTDMKFGHYDLELDAAGNDLAFGAEASGTYAKRFVTRNLATGAITAISPATSFNWHASARDITRPGWGYAATNDLLGPVAGELYAIKTDGTVERFAHHRAINQAYNDAPHPVPSPDGRRIAFSSNWGTAGGAIQAYVMDTRQLCPNGLPQ